jgi:hypothetical protein
MTQPPFAVATDYAAAMLVARRWKNRLVALLLLFLLAQIGAFVAVRFGEESKSTAAATTAPSTQSVAATAAEMVDRVAWLINVLDFVSIIAILTLCAVLALVIGIMLVGRLVGVSYLTGAFLWCVVLAVMLFPWQALWDYSSAGLVQSSSSAQTSQEVWPQFGLPGILYTWPELKNRAHFTNERSTAAYLGWARFAGWPAVAVIMLLVIHRRSALGLKLALGEKQIQLPEAQIPSS